MGWAGQGGQQEGLGSPEPVPTIAMGREVTSPQKPCLVLGLDGVNFLQKNLQARPRIPFSGAQNIQPGEAKGLRDTQRTQDTLG